MLVMRATSVSDGPWGAGDWGGDRRRIKRREVEGVYRVSMQWCITGISHFPVSTLMQLQPIIRTHKVSQVTYVSASLSVPSHPSTSQTSQVVSIDQVNLSNAKKHKVVKK
jgi:hypothetical protein